MRYRYTPTRGYYIPAGSMKVADKQSDAVAYLYTAANGKPAARVFFGKQAKPVSAYCYRSEAERTAAVTRAFESRRQSLGFKAARRAERSGKVRKVELGGLYYTSWGYDQTNIDFYEVVELVGKTSARVRPVSSISASNGNEPWMTGKAVPAAGQYTGPAVLVRVTGDDFKIDRHYANRWHGRPVGWTAYA